MKATTRGIAVLLTCVGCASTVAAQAPQDGFTRVFELRQENSNSNNNKAQTQAEAQRRAKAEAAQRRGPRGQRGGQGGGGQAEASETFTRIVHLDRGATFDLRNVSGGDVTITGGGGREGRIEVSKRVRASNDQRAQQVLQQFRVEIAERGGNVEVRTIPPMGRGPGEARVDYVVTLPANINVMLRSTSGKVRVQNISGDELSIDTLQGNVTVSDLQSRLVDLHSVMGDMLLNGIAAQRASVQSMRGNVEYTGPLQRTGQYRIQTHTGDIRMMIPPGGPGFDLDAMTNKGELQSDFAVKPQQGQVVRRPNPLRFLRGPVGDAGAMLTTYSFGGNIVIVKLEGQ